jgi:uncharacterized phage-associated protein
MIDMAKAVDVARYILEQREARNHMTTAFALQKLLYYCQSWMLVARDRPLFEDEIQAWEHGPVVKSVYPYCRGRRYVFAREVTGGDADALTLEERALVDRVLALYEGKDDHKLGDDLEKMSHAEKPWSDVRDTSNQIITPESMLSYYSALQANPGMEHSAPIPDLADVSDRMFISQEDADWLQSVLSN